MSTPKEKPNDKQENFAGHEQNWENPDAPEQAADPRDVEQLKRQKKAAEIRKDNLNDPEE